MLGLPDGDPRVPLRPRRRAHRHRQRPRRGVEADVRRLPARPRRARRHAVPSRSTSRPTTAPTSTASRGWTAPAASSSRAASTLPEGSPDDPPDAETLWGLATRKNDLVQEKIRTVGVDVYPGSVRYLHAVKRRGPAHGRACRPRPTPSRCCRSPGSADLIDHRVDGVVAKQRGLPGKPAPDTFLAAAADLGVPKEQAVVFEDALAGVESGPRGRLRLRRRRRPRSGTPTRCASTARTSSCRTCGAAGTRDRRWPACGQVGGAMSPDPGRPFTVEPWLVREPTLDMAAHRRQSSPSSRCPTATSGCAATSTRASRTPPPAPTSTRSTSSGPLPYAEGGYGYPESGQTIINVTNGKIIRLLVDDEPFDLRYGQLHRHQRVLDLQSGTLTREVELGIARRASGQGAQRAAGLAHPARRRGDLLRGRGRGPGADRACSPSWWPTSSCPRPHGGRPPRRGRAAQPAGRPSSTAAHDDGATLIHHTRHSGLRVAAAMDHEVEGPARAPRSPPRPARTSAAPP